MLNRHIAGALMLALVVLLISPQPARAYVDPGSGTMMYQLAYAAFLAGGFYFRRLLGRFSARRK